MSGKVFEAVIIGGGVMGCMAAYALAKRGMRNTLLIESGHLGNAATGQSAAMILHQTNDELLSSLAKISIAEYDKLVIEFGNENIGYDKTGSLLFSTDKDDYQSLLQMMQMQKKLGIDCRVVSGDKFKSFCPAIDPSEILGGIYCPGDGYLSARGLLQELRKKLIHWGVEIRQNEEVTHIKRASGNAKFVINSTRGGVRSNRIINAAGGWAPRVASWLDDKIPINLSKRHIIIFRCDKKAEKFPILENITDEWYCRYAGQNILIGVGSVDVVGRNDTFDFTDVDREPEQLEEAYSYIKKNFPDWEGVLCESYWAGVRLMTADKRPIISTSRNHDGLYHCAGLSEFGMSTAPALAELLASLVLEDLQPQIPSAIQELSLYRELGDTLKSPAISDLKNVLISTDPVREKLDPIIRNLPSKYTTPLYIYDLEKLRQDSVELKAAYKEFDLLYALKANPLSEIVRNTFDSGFGADVSSLTELDISLSLGIKKENIIFGGPGKTSRILCNKILESGCIVSIESLNELEAFQDSARAVGKRLRALIRINSSHRPQAAGEFMAGGASQFGTDEEVYKNFYNLIDRNLTEILGIHVHVASQVLDQEAIEYHYKRTAELALSVMKGLDYPLQVINFGGGLGVPYSNHGPTLNYKSIASRTLKAIQNITGTDTLDDVRLQLELGRSVVANCGVFVTKILDIKKSRGQWFIIVESGISGFSRPSMPWAQTHRCWLMANRLGETIDYTIAGESCLPADILVPTAALQSPKVGDLLCVAQTGAYGFSMSLLHWSGLVPPLEVVHDNGQYTLATDLTNRIKDQDVFLRNNHNARQC